MREGDDAKALAVMLRGLRVLSEEEVRRIQVPVAALISANDRFMANVRRLSGVLPGLKVMEIPDAHVMQKAAQRRILSSRPQLKPGR